jgi:hypothetical protein
VIEREIAGGAENHYGCGAERLCFTHLADRCLNIIEVDDCGPPDPLIACESITQPAVVRRIKRGREGVV